MTTSDSVNDAHRRPTGTTDQTIEALGKLSEALEVVEHARGLLYGFHRLSGKADLALGEVVDLMRDAPTGCRTTKRYLQKLNWANSG